ncbi:MAG: hypothetical protein K2L42_03540 [Clostridia bacterium]|nr:hypothetical protein [Clostridia bacterium]
MEFDIIDITEEELKNLTAVQMQLLRTAQKNKNNLKYNLEKDLEIFSRLMLTDDVKNSSIFEQKKAELTAEYNRETAVLIEQLNYSLHLNEPYPDDEDLQKVGYIVDFSLNYTERYRIVRDYYLSISDSSLRMAQYGADEVAKKYLGSYYTTLYDVLYTYSK